MGCGVMLVVLLGCAALQVQPPLSTRREALRIGAAAIVAPAQPVFARSKASVAPNKPEGVGANAKEYQQRMYAEQKAGMAGDKGTRGVASVEFEKSDSVVRNRKQNMGLARDADGKKIAVANRNRTPEELGLKQWDGS